MRLKLFVLIYHFAILDHYMYAQPFNIGDKCPDFLLENVMNYKDSVAKFSDFAGKAIIIDFFSTTCSVCIGSMPKVDSLQKKYASELQFVMVSKASRAKVQKLFTDRQKLQNIKLLTVPSDKSMNESFPHLSVPHQVWIDKDRVIRAITSVSAMTDQNVKALLTNNSLAHLPLKYDSPYKPGGESSTLVANEWDRSKHKLLSYSYFSSYRRELVSLTSLPTIQDEELVRITATNQSVSSLYLLAFNRLRQFHPSRIEFEVANPDQYKADHKTKENLYCYELIIQGGNKNKAYATMLTDLNSFFGLEGRLERKNVKCFVLKRTESQLNLTSHHPGGADVYDSANNIVARNVIFTLFVINKLAEILPYQLFDETGHTGRVDLEIPKTFIDTEHFNKELARYGLMLEEQVRELDVLVIRDSRGKEQ